MRERRIPDAIELPNGAKEFPCRRGGATTQEMVGAACASADLFAAGIIDLVFGLLFLVAYRLTPSGSLGFACGCSDENSLKVGAAVLSGDLAAPHTIIAARASECETTKQVENAGRDLTLHPVAQHQNRLNHRLR